VLNNGTALSSTTTIDHVAIAVRDTADAVRLYCDGMGLKAETTEIAVDENLKVTFLQGANTRIEVLEPLAGDSAVARFLEKRGEGLHHICFAVLDVAASLRSLADAGFQLVDDVPRLGRHGELLAFVHPRTANGVLIELYEYGSAAQLGAAGGLTDGDPQSTQSNGAGARPSP
jgi:methylmalonyl-CoA epimerase